MEDLRCVELNCIMCEKDHNVFVDRVGYLDWKRGLKLIQNALPDATLEGRESLISTICKQRQKEVFA